MAETFNKKEREKKKSLRKKEKLQKKEQRKDNPAGGGWESMLAYVDENGVLSDTPSDPKKKREVKAKNIEIGIPRREEDPNEHILTGIISYFDDTKGYGFIKTSDDMSYFVHQNDISGKKPSKGASVRFEKQKGQKGWVAINVAVA